MNAKNKPEHILVVLGKKRFENESKEMVHFLDNEGANSLLNNLTECPHAFVLACCMDRQTKAERAWAIPARIREIIGDFSLDRLVKISLDEYKKLFKDNNLHRFNDTMSKVFFSAVQRISKEYGGDASKIWCNRPSSASVVYGFLQFDGVGIKIATMAANILARQFRVEFADYFSIDVSPDTHILRILRRSGLVESTANIDSVVYKAREMNPTFPGIIDYSCWEIGRTWCKPSNPDCENCPIRSECAKEI